MFRTQESIFLVEARESQRDFMRVAALDELPRTESSSSTHTAGAAESSNKPYLNLTLRSKIQKRSTVTSLESLASTIDLRDEAADKNRKRNLIGSIDKESQVKEQRNSFRGLFPSGDSSKGSPKKTRRDDA